jgi:hypothetical protein
MLHAFLLQAGLAAAPPPIIGGAETDAWPAVGALVAQQGTTNIVICSATLVANDAVLTAAHCGEALQELMDVGLDGAVIFGETVDGGEPNQSEVLDIVVHPDWEPRTFKNDLALVAISPVADVEPVPFTEEAPRPAWADDMVVGVGWGDTDDDGGGAGVKRALTMAVTDVDVHFVYIEADGDANLCHGDSGGPIFRSTGGDGDEVVELAAVSAFVYQSGDQAGCEGGAAGAVRADRAELWVESVRTGTEWEGIFRTQGPSLPHETPTGCSAAANGGRGATGPRRLAPWGAFIGAAMLWVRRRRPSNLPAGPQAQATVASSVATRRPH